MCKLNNDKSESHPQEAKRLIGIDYDQFLALVNLAEKRHLEKRTEIEKKNSYYCSHCEM